MIVQKWSFAVNLGDVELFAINLGDVELIVCGDMVDGQEGEKPYFDLQNVYRCTIENKVRKYIDITDLLAELDVFDKVQELARRELRNWQINSNE